MAAFEYNDQLPPNGFSEVWCQQDEWSCAFHTARILDIQRRKLRGERQAPIQTIQTVLAHHKKLVWDLQALQAKHKGMKWPPAAAAEPEPEMETEGPAPEAPAAPEVTSVKHLKCKSTSGTSGKPTSLEQAMEKAKTSKCCKPRKSDGVKGCSKCMGQYFGAIRCRNKFS